MEKNTIVISKKTASNMRSLDVSGDIIVPDIKPDIVSIIDSNGIAYIYKEEVSNGRVRFDGNVDMYIVYLADNGETRSIQTTLNFVETFEDSSINESSIIKQKIILDSVDAKVLNERKISLSSTVRVQTEVFENSELEIPEDFNEFENIEKLQETLEIKSVVGRNKNKTTIKEDIKVDNSLEIAEILKVEVEVSNLENKISYNKVLAKADANIKILFSTENGKISSVNTTIPIMSFIDINQIVDGNICNIEYKIKNMLFKVNSKEMHSISTQIEFEVVCEAYDIKKINIIQDMYGTKEELKFSKKEIGVQTNKLEKVEKINLNERVLVEDILNIYDVKCQTRMLKSNQAGSFYNCECELNLTFYYEADNRSGLNVKNIIVPFVLKGIETPDKLEFKINNKKFTVNGENVDCDVEILYKENCDCLKNISIIENVEKQEFTENNDYKMVMYFVKSGDTLWNIAKQFKVCMNDIINLNSLENPDRIKPGDRLYIMR